jgi:hypothetical protein
MKKLPFYIALLLLGSCSALQEESVDPDAGAEITLDVSLADAPTKATYTAEDNGLKCTWAAGDSISVISLHNGVIATVDVFTTTNGGRTAAFSGRYTGKFTDPVIALYPVVKGSQQQGYYSQTLPGHTSGMIKVKKGESVLHFSPEKNYTFSQGSNASYAHIAQSEVMTGTVDLNTNGGAVSMQKRTAVLKVNVSGIPASEKVRSLTLRVVGGTPFTNQSATLSLASPASTWTAEQPCDSTTLNLGNIQYGMSSGFVCENGTLTAYVPVFPNSATPALQGDAVRTLKVAVNTDLSRYAAQKEIPAKAGADYAYSLTCGTLSQVSATAAWAGDVDPTLTHWLRTIHTLADVDAAAEAMKAGILSSTSNLISITGTTYYVSNNGNDGNSGLSPASPIKTLAKVNDLTLQPGDGVLFRRGDLWRGQVKVKDGVTYSAYGSGDKPRIYNSLDARTGTWTEMSGHPHIYRYSQPIDHAHDVGNLVFNNGDDGCAYKVVPIRDRAGNTFYEDTSHVFNGWQSLYRDRDMYHDPQSGYVYLYSTGGNPYKRWNSIEAALKGNTFDGYNDGKTPYISFTVDNICIKYTGSHGVGAGHVKNLTVTNCEIAWIGGSLQNDDHLNPPTKDYFMYSRPVRYGNGVEIWGTCKSFKVENNYIRQVYDAAISPQYSTDNTSFNELYCEDVNFVNNLIEKCVYAVEYWFSVPSEKDEVSGFRNFLIRGNIMRMAGPYGWGYQRFNKETPTLIQAGETNHHTHSVNFRVEGNILDRGKPQLVRFNAGNPAWLPECRANVYLSEDDKHWGNILEANPKKITL